MVLGRLRTHDREDIANKLVEWAQLDDSYNLNGFCAKNFIVPEKLSQWAKEDDYFRQAYLYAKGCLGDRRERALAENKIHAKAYDANINVYDHFRKTESREEKEFDAAIGEKALEGQETTEEVLRKAHDGKTNG